MNHHSPLFMTDFPIPTPSSPSSSSSSSTTSGRPSAGQLGTIPTTFWVDRWDRRHVRRRSVPPGDLGGSSCTLTSSSSSSSSPSSPGGTRNRRRKEGIDDPRCKIEQVFFPPFEESSAYVPSISDDGRGLGDDRLDKDKDKVKVKTEGWARLLSSPSTAVESSRPPRSMLNHRRTQSSTDILLIAPTPRTPLRPSGFTLNQITTTIPPPQPARSQTTLPVIHGRSKSNVSISPLTRSAREMLNVDSRGGVERDSPIEACAGGDGLLEVIKLDRLNRRRRTGEGGEGISQEDLNPLRRSATLPSGRNKRKALSADLTVSGNRRYPTVPPRALTHLPEITIIEPPKVRNRPPPLRNLPPPSWSSPGPSPPLTSLATPFSTDMFVMPYPNPVASMTPGLLSPNYTPPHSPGHGHHQSRSVPVTPQSDPMEGLCSTSDRPIPPRIRRRSSLVSLESSTETIRPWHMVQLTPKPSRAQLSSSFQEPVHLSDDPGSTGVVCARQGKPRSPRTLPNNHRSNSAVGLELETLVCDWDFESDEDRGRAVVTERKRRIRATARASVGSGAGGVGGGRRVGGREPVERERRARS